jgi:hypothetical protein
LANPEAAISIGSRVLSGDFGPTMGAEFDLNRSEFWFKVPFHNSPSVREEDLERINVLYRANLPILPNLGMMKRQTRVLVGFAEDYIKGHSAKVSFLFMPNGIC